MDELESLIGDPLGSLDPFAGLGLPRKSKAKTKPLSEKEQKSVLREVLNMGTGGLQYVGETLDKPGRAVRGLLAGKPGELANLIPFSDTLGLTDPSQSVSGRDLLEQAGLAGPNQVGRLDAGDVAGFGAEILLDPTTYLTFGASAVGKAGKTAKAAGLSTKGAARYKTLGQSLAGASDDVLRAASEAAAKQGTTLEALSGQKLGGLFGVKVPGLPSFVPEFAQGDAAQAIGEGLGSAAMLPLRLAGKSKKLAKAGENIAAYWKGAFDPSVQNQFDPVAQTLAKEGTEHINRGQAKVLEGFYKDNEELGKLVDDFTAQHGQDPFFAPGKVSPAEIVRRAVQHSAETRGAPGAFDLVTGGAIKSHAAQAASNVPLQNAELLGKQFPKDTAKAHAVADPVFKLPTLDEAERLHAELKELEKNADVSVLGEEGAKEWSKLHRKANSTHDIAGANDAFKRIAEIEAKLTDEQKNILYGIGGTGASADDYADLARGLRGISGANPKELADSVIYAATKLPPKGKPIAEWTFSEQAAAAKFQRAMDIAKQHGWDTADLSKMIINGVAGRFDDPEDAAFVLDVIFGKSKPKLPELSGTISPAPVAQTVEEPLRSSIPRHSTNRALNATFISPDLESRAAKLGEGIVAAENEAFARYQELGGNVQALNESEEFSHLFRQPLEKKARPSGLKMRTAAMKYLPAEQVNSMLRDPSLLMSGASKAKPDEVARRLLEGNYGKLMMDASMSANVPPQQAAKDMAEWLSSKGTSYSREGKNFYGNDILKNKTDYLTSLNRKTANMQAVHSVLAKNLTSDLEGTVGVAEALAGAGLDPTSAIEHMARTLGQAPDALRKMRVPEDIAGAAASVLQKQQSPEWMKKIGAVIDWGIGGYKKNLTVPFPAFHLRNRASGMWMNLASNLIETPGDLNLYRQASSEARSILKNKGANKDLIGEMVAHAAVPTDLASGAVEDLGRGIATAIPKDTRYLNPLTGPLQVGKDLLGNTKSAYNEARAAGSGRVSSGLQAGYKGLHETGTEAARQVEWMNRAEMYLYLKKKGYTPAAAAAEVRKLQIDYSNATAFEKNVMKRIVPFYTFTRRNLPVLIEKMIERPGGFAGQTVRASNVGRSEDEFVPPYVGEGMSVPLPGGDGRYLSELGLPTDQFANLFATGPTRFGSVKRTGQKLLSQLAPPLKAAIELPTGINLFSGKPFNEMYQYPSNDPLFNAILSESPASRFISAVRTLGDPRKEGLSGASTKAMNLLSGARITDVSGGIEKQKEYAAKKILDEMLREEKGIGSFSEVYQKEGSELTPEAERLYRAYRGLVAKQRKEKKAAKK